MNKVPTLLCFSGKIQGTCIHVLKGVDVRVRWSNVVEETGEPGEKTPNLDGRSLSCHMPRVSC